MENEKRLIDANELMGDVYRSDEQQKTDVWHTSDIEYLVMAQPTVDAVEVVRCKDCGYWVHVEDGYGDCTNRRFHLDGHPDPTMEFNGFCSCGERKYNERKAD